MTDEESRVLDACRGVSIAALNKWKYRTNSTIGRLSRAILRWRATWPNNTVVKEPNLSNADALAKLLCDIAWENGYILSYKLEVRK